VTDTRLEVRALVVERGRHILVDGLDFAAPAGSLIQLAGPNGSGKTSVLRTLAGLSAPAAGDIAWRGRRLTGAGGYAGELNFIGHLPALSVELDARENLAFQVALSCAPRACTVEQALANLGAARIAHRPVRQLSAGQRQRIALARLVLFRCPLWMLDEPFTALDVAARRLLEAIIDAHVSAGGTVIIATHQEFASTHPLERIDLSRTRLCA
jgi:heme exporter protein A